MYDPESMTRAIVALMMIAVTAGAAIVFTPFVTCCRPACAAVCTMHHRDGGSESSAAADVPQRPPARAALDAARHAAPALAARPLASIVRASPASIRSLVAVSSLRCDDDVGLHTLLATFRI